MITLLGETRPTARKPHRCELCHGEISVGTTYLNQRCCGDGSLWTFKAHHDCNSAYWSWGVEEGDVIDLADLTDGHMPPCWHAWNHDREYWSHTERFIGPPAPCSCEITPASHKRYEAA